MGIGKYKIQKVGYYVWQFVQTKILCKDLENSVNTLYFGYTRMQSSSACSAAMY